MTARTVYVVTYGEYSSYGIDAVFESRTDAEAYAGKDARVEEYPMFATGDQPEDYKHQVCQAVLWIDRAGRIVDNPGPWTSTNETHAADYAAAERQWHGGDYPVVVRANMAGHGIDGWRIATFAPTPEAAMKATRERAAKAASLVALGLDPAQME